MRQELLNRAIEAYGRTLAVADPIGFNSGTNAA